MTSHTAELAEDLAKDYANYAKLDLSNQASIVFYITSMNNCTMMRHTL